MDGDSRGALIRQADQTAALAARWRERSSRFQGMARSRLSALAKAREEQSGLVKEARQAGLAVADMGTEQSTLASDRLFVSVDLRTGVWNAVWAEGTDVAIFGARFSVKPARVISLGTEEQRPSFQSGTRWGKAGNCARFGKPAVCAWSANCGFMIASACSRLEGEFSMKAMPRSGWEQSS